MIVVTGATGTIGRALIEELGGAARATVRRPARRYRVTPLRR